MKKTFYISLLIIINLNVDAQEISEKYYRDTIINKKGEILKIIEERPNSDTLHIHYKEGDRSKPIYFEIVISDTCSYVHNIDYDKKGRIKEKRKYTDCGYPRFREISKFKKGEKKLYQKWVQVNNPPKLKVSRSDALKFKLVEEIKF